MGPFCSAPGECVQNRRRPGMAQPAPGQGSQMWAAPHPAVVREDTPSWVPATPLCVFQTADWRAGPCSPLPGATAQ